VGAKKMPMRAASSEDKRGANFVAWDTRFSLFRQEFFDPEIKIKFRFFLVDVGHDF